MNRADFLRGGDELCEFGRKHREDAELIRKALVKHGFINAGLDDAVWLWNEYSQKRSGLKWLPVTGDLFEIYILIEPYIRKYIYPDPE